MKRFKLAIAALLILLLPLHALAHPGKTDYRGGHTDRSTGVYHYHHGYSAHFHTNGECPYDFKDKTGQNSGSPSYSSYNSVKATATPAPSRNRKINTDKVEDIVSMVICGISFVLIVLKIIAKFT